MEMGRHIFSLVKEDFPILRELKKMDFDLVLADYTEPEAAFTTYLDKPSMS